MRLEFDRQADAIYIYLTHEPYSYGQDLDDLRRVDFSADGKPMGIELLCVRKGIDLRDLPSRAEVEIELAKLGKKVKILA